MLLVMNIETIIEILGENKRKEQDEKSQQIWESSVKVFRQREERER